MSTAVDALAASPFRHLADADLLRLVADLVTDDDALAVALVCRPLRDAIFAHYPKPAEGGQLDPPPRRLRTAARAYASPVSRLRWALDEAGCPVYGSLLLRAAEAGDVHSLEHLWQLSPSHGAHQIEDSPSVSAPTTSPPRPTRLARPPNWPAHWPVHELEPPSTSADTLPRHSDGPQLCEAAAMGGHLAALQLLRAKGCGWDSAVTNSACIHGHLPVLRWANAVRLSPPAPTALPTCRQSCLLPRTRLPGWRQRCLQRIVAMLRAPLKVHPRPVSLSQARNRPAPRTPPFTSSCCVTYPRAQQGCPIHALACHLAAAHGHVHIVQFLRRAGLPWCVRSQSRPPCACTLWPWQPSAWRFAVCPPTEPDWPVLGPV